MTTTEQKRAAKAFVAKWSGKGYEKGECQEFWNTLLRDVFGIAKPEEWIRYEIHVPTGFIDCYMPKTQVVIEQKGFEKGLDDRDAFKQAMMYVGAMSDATPVRFVITCNFKEFWIYDRHDPDLKPLKIKLADLPKEVRKMSFLTEVNEAPVRISHEVTVSKAAGKVVGLLYNALLKKFEERGLPVDEKARKSLNVFCVRTVFCAYAEDAGLFEKDQFVNYLRQFDAAALRDRMLQLFRMLNTAPEKRDPFERDDLKAFPFVSSALFEDMDISVPQFDDNIRTIILDKMSADFDWSEISPTIFGAIFESTLNPEIRHDEGMHYTTPENIHRVIDPLFLDDLKDELETIKKDATPKTRNRKLEDYQKKLGSLTFLDPACGSGNFLTETFVSLRRLENEAIALRQRGQSELDLDGTAIHVKIEQFHGIELQDFAVTVAMSALWIAESQMMTETQEILHKTLQFLPLKSYSHIRHENALRVDWESSLPEGKHFDYIMGNPPFVGKKEQSKSQKFDLMSLVDGVRGAGNLDYVVGWYAKAFPLVSAGGAKGAFVSTNSITQGEQAGAFGELIRNAGVSIDFAWKTFVWNSEATEKAHVHVVIIGFGAYSDRKVGGRIFLSDKQVLTVEQINNYLCEGPLISILSRTTPISQAPLISYGSMPIDDGHLILEKDDVDLILHENPANAELIKEYVGGAEILKGVKRWCLWLKDISPALIRKSAVICERIRLTEEFRKSSSRSQTLTLAKTPALFGEIRQPTTDMLVIPKVSSQRRQYIPIAYVKPSVIVNGSALIVPEATHFHFGVLSSSVHNGWMRAVAGRMKSDYQYSGNIVYNNFPWPMPGDAQKTAVEQSATAILEAREKHQDCSLADMYDPMLMPSELRKAHEANDAAVLAAYGFDKKLSETEIVAKLFEMYVELTKK